MYIVLRRTAQWSASLYTIHSTSDSGDRGRRVRFLSKLGGGRRVHCSAARGFASAISTSQHAGQAMGSADAAHIDALHVRNGRGLA